MAKPAVRLGRKATGLSEKKAGLQLLNAMLKPSLPDLIMP